MLVPPSNSSENLMDRQSREVRRQAATGSTMCVPTTYVVSSEGTVYRLVNVSETQEQHFSVGGHANMPSFDRPGLVRMLAQISFPESSQTSTLKAARSHCARSDSYRTDSHLNMRTWWSILRSFIEVFTSPTDLRAQVVFGPQQVLATLDRGSFPHHAHFHHDLKANEPQRRQFDSKFMHRPYFSVGVN